LLNLNSGCADAAEILILVKWEVDYWKSEFITFVEEYFKSIFVNFKVKINKRCIQLDTNVFIDLILVTQKATCQFTDMIEDL
jgi:hypothetical protein